MSRATELYRLERERNERLTKEYPLTPDEAWNPALRDYEGGRNISIKTHPGKGERRIKVHVQLIDKSRVPEVDQDTTLYIWESSIPYDMTVLDFIGTRADITTDRVFIVDENLNRT
jgi:PAS domain-containing protein